jgi:hypothetical protein
MSNATNETINEQIFEGFKERILNEEIEMNLVIAAMNAGKIKTFPDLHGALWNFDCELYSQSIDEALHAFIMFKNSMKEFTRLTNGL